MLVILLSLRQVYREFKTLSLLILWKGLDASTVRILRLTLEQQHNEEGLEKYISVADIEVLDHCIPLLPSDGMTHM